MKINFKQSKKYFIGVLVLVILVGGSLYVLRNKEIEIKFNENGSLVVPDKKWYEGHLSFSKRVIDLQDRLEEMEKNDDFGGATPQETFDGFVEALKVGDIDLASQYFVFNKREQKVKSLAIGKQNGVLNLLIGDLEKEKKEYQISDKHFRYRTFDEDNIAEFSFDLKFNEYTKVWKIESL
ncbi:MAG: hypothetical protein U9P50_01345 [Patescibacteria group bacterium]|nr:hypothetical protein [Patescibacteria group bacterium]